MPNISRSKGNQTIEFGQLIKYKMRSNFLEISYIKYGGETGPRPFYEKPKSSPLWINSLKCHRVFYCISKLMCTKIY